MSEIFGTGRPRVYTIPPGANFLDELATVLARDTGLMDNPEALADALIYVPNRRSERALAFALHKAGGRAASLLPDIRALGDLETDEPPPSAEAALADLPPMIAPAQRIGTLTRLVMAYFEHTGRSMPATSCLAAARELARLLDQAALSGDVDWGALESLVPELQLAGHWQQSVAFLSIITAQWPAKLEEATAMDPYARRYAAAEALVAEWQARPPETTVIVAGSTGATPASRLLMKSVLALPKGCVVLPGLDRELSAAALSQVLASPSHPQFTLARTLKDLSLTPSDVGVWPGEPTLPEQAARQRLIHEALAPAQSTADWTQRLADLSGDGDTAGFVTRALSGLTRLDAKDDTEEALLAALMLRETLERDGETAALVTPDAGLARHVSAMLKRWDVDVAPSAGLPLLQTDAGSLALLVADWLLDPSHPVALMAVLHHPASRFAAAALHCLDRHFLRGPRRWQNWAELCAHVEAQTRHRPEDIESARHLLAEIGEVLTGQSDPNLSQEGATWYQHVSAVATEMSQPPRPWIGEDGAALSRLMRHLIELSEPLGPQAPQLWNELLQAEAALVSVQSGPTHPRLAIWGPLEARLQTADRIILAGLNEGIWPAQPAADAFLPRVFRQKIGLSDPEERIGLSAHDFAQLAAAPRVTLLSSERRDDKPAVASRWIWRLQTLARGALGEAAKTALAPPAEANPVSWLHCLEKAPELPSGFTAEPRPKPPLSARPPGLSVTRVEQLVRDPYAIYCEYVLGLRRLDPLDLPADVRIRGTAIHRALERLEEEDTPQTADGLLDLIEQELRDNGEPEVDILALRDRRRSVCADYLDWRAEAQQHIQGRPYTEIRGSLDLTVEGVRFTLRGTADRIEQRANGSIAILDFKTGKPPTEKQVRAGLSPQMPLQGLIARDGGYADIGRTRVEALTYVRFGTAFDVQELGAGNQRAKLEPLPVGDLIAEAEAGLIRLITAFSDPDHPYLSAPRPERVSYESDYSRLARRQEWAGQTSYD